MVTRNSSPATRAGESLRNDVESLLIERKGNPRGGLPCLKRSSLSIRLCVNDKGTFLLGGDWTS